VSVPEISEQLRDELDDVPVSKLAEYLCSRLQLDDGEKLLQLLFRDGRYQQMTRYTPIRAQR
jgi:hypothetical protein